MSNIEFKDHIDALGYAFHSFKEENNQRLDSLAKKQATDPLLEEKLSKIEDTMDALEKTLEQQRSQEKKSSPRPLVSVQNGDDHAKSHTKAFLQYVRSGRKENLRNLEQKFHGESPEDGGYFIPKNILQTLDSPENTNLLRRYARVLQTSSRKLEILKEKTDFPVKWLDVANLEAEETPKLSNLSIPLHTLYSRPSMEHNLLEDSQFPIEQWIFDRILKQMALIENHSFFQGQGDQQPTGLLNHVGQTGDQGIQRLETGHDGGFAENEGENILYRVVDTLKDVYLSDAMWMMSRTAHSAIRRLKDSQENYLWQPPLMRENSPMILGYPVVVTDHLPELEKNQASVVFGNFHEGYAIVDAAHPMHVVRDEKTRKPFVELYISKRVGGDVVHGEALKAIQFSQ